MASINEIARRRRQFWRAMKRSVKDEQSAVNAAMRHIERILERKRDFPTDEDLVEFDSLLEVSADAARQTGQLLQDGYPD